MRRCNGEAMHTMLEAIRRIDPPLAHSERLILLVMAAWARTAECEDMSMSNGIAGAYTGYDRTYINKVLHKLKDRGIIAEGDDSVVKHIHAFKRPQVWSLAKGLTSLPDSEFQLIMEAVRQDGSRQANFNKFTEPVWDRLSEDQRGQVCDLSNELEMRGGYR